MPSNLKRSNNDSTARPRYIKKKRTLEARKEIVQRGGPDKYTAPTPNDVASPEIAMSGPRRSLEPWRVSEIIDGEVYYIPQFVDEETANTWLSELTKLDTWYHPKLKVYGKEVSQSRSIAAYATEESLVVKYSGHVVTLHHTYPPVLSEIQKRVEDVLGETFIHVMLNRYADGSEYIGKHRDTKENKMIVSLSLGAERTFIMMPNKSVHGAKAHKWKLANGSLVVMKGKTQDNWKHEVPKEPKIKNERISLTFRQLVSSDGS